MEPFLSPKAAIIRRDLGFGRGPGYPETQIGIVHPETCDVDWSSFIPSPIETTRRASPTLPAPFIGLAVLSGMMFDPPLSRDDIADYLALDPDTLSRLFSRLKAKRMIATSQGRATAADWEALCRLSPLSGPMVEFSKRCRNIE
ncbi:MAG: hypothetical protein CTY20_07515 [Hyphomicrobium sp.]|nr:MAG: hypothetical protein CTY20_07515 [Hyphomicrobium sp.]